MDLRNINRISKSLDKTLLFTSKTCKGCQELEEEFKRLHVDMTSITQIDVDSDDPLVKKYKIMSVPHILLLDIQGKVIERDIMECIDYLVSIVE